MIALALILAALARQLKPCPDCLGGCAACQHLGLVPKDGHRNLSRHVRAASAEVRAHPAYPKEPSCQ